MTIVFTLFVAVCFAAAFYAFSISNATDNTTSRILFDLISLLFLMMAILALLVFLCFRAF